MVTCYWLLDLFALIYVWLLRVVSLAYFRLLSQVALVRLLSLPSTGY